MNWTMKDSVESVMKVQSVDLKNCTKEMVIEYHNKTIYDCKNVSMWNLLWEAKETRGQLGPVLKKVEVGAERLLDARRGNIGRVAHGSAS